MTTNQKIELLTTLFGNSPKFSTIVANICCEDLYYKSNRHNKELDKKPLFDPSELTMERHYVGFMPNFIYENSVNNQQKREGLDPSFEVKTSWFKHISKWLICHKTDETKMYLFGKWDKTIYTNKIYFNTEKRYLTEDEISKMLPYRKEKKSIESTQINQNVEKIVECRAISLDNVISIKCGATITF